jgi:hypothetical protein
MSKAPTVDASNVALVNAAVTTILTATAPNNSNSYQPGISPPGPAQTIEGTFIVTTGATATAIALSCFDNAGNQVQATQTTTAAASAQNNISFTFHDTTGAYRSSYQIRVSQTGGTSNGSVTGSAYVMTDG